MPAVPPPPAAQTFRRTLAVAGLLAGAGLVAYGLFAAAPAPAPPPGAVAGVNGAPIGQALFDAAVESLTSGLQPLSPAQARARVLARLIDEELLLQRALELNLIRSDRLLRAAVVQAMIALILQENLALEPAPGELQRFYEENRGLFTRGEGLHVAYLFLPPGAEASAGRAARELAAGADFAVMQKRWMPSPPVPLPDTPLPLSALAAYLGGDLADEARRLPPGSHAGPFFRDDGIYFLSVKARIPAGAPPYAEIDQEVLQRWQREQDDVLLRRVLDALRRRADIRTGAQTGP